VFRAQKPVEPPQGRSSLFLPSQSRLAHPEPVTRGVTPIACEEANRLRCFTDMCGDRRTASRTCNLVNIRISVLFSAGNSSSFLCHDACAHTLNACG